jgi:hypothetical protein
MHRSRGFVNVFIYLQVVGERSVVVRSISESRCGRSRSENVGLSSENMGENPMPRNPKDSSGRLVRGGLVGT